MASHSGNEEPTPPDNIPLQDLPPSHSGSSPGRTRRSFHRTRSLFQHRGGSPNSESIDRRRSRGHSPFSSKRYDPVPDVPELRLDDDPFITTSTSTSRNPEDESDVSPVEGSYDNGQGQNVFDNEGGMNVNLDTMREGLMEVLEGEVATGSWLPGHVRIGSRNASPGRRGTLRLSRPSIHGRHPSSTKSIETEVEMPYSRPTSSGTDSLDPAFYRYSLPTDVDDSDTIALTDPMHLQPMSGGTNYGSGSGSVSPRGRLRSTSNGKQPVMSASPRLGDDLNNAELGLNRLATTSSQSPSAHARKKSLIPGNPNSPIARRVSVAVQNISQRVVNLSNDPNADLVRKPSLKSLKGGHESPPVVVQSSGEEGSKRPSTYEKPVSTPMERRPTEQKWYLSNNPLRGKSLKLFPPTNRLRIFFCDVLVHPITEPFILLLIVFQTILLTADSAKDFVDIRRNRTWGRWTDYATLAIFSIYTLEIIARTIVSGFIINPVGPNEPPPEGVRNYCRRKFHEFFSAAQHKTKSNPPSFQAPPSLLRSVTLLQMSEEHPGHAQAQQRMRLARRAFLRHSFNRIDFVAVVSYWITFCMVNFSSERHTHLYLFRMMSCLRILRLLGITSGTSVILRSLKKAAPLVLNVSFLIGFFWLLFAIIGVQSFKSSLRRTCVWKDPAGVQGDYIQEFQFCGGYLDNTTFEAKPYQLPNGKSAESDAKGYICPVNSICIEGSNPYAGTVSFDNIFQSMELVFVIMSSNTFSDLMYYTADSDYFASSLFFVFGIIVLCFWLMNLLVAVITTSFQVIREEEGKQSTFTARQEDEEDLDEPETELEREMRKSQLQRLYEKTEFVWILIVAIGLLTSCVQSSTMSAETESIINHIELSVTVLLLFEICFRFTADWRYFHKSPRNWVDLGLAVMTSIIELPPIRRHQMTYAWLTIFQIMRVYRVVLSVPATRNLLSLVLGNAAGLFNLLFFVAFITFLCSIFAVQLLRGDIPDQDDSGNINRITFSNIYNSLLGMYQILSTENWTIILYAATQYQVGYNVAWISAVFFIVWFILANAIVLNMFIAVIQENFDVTEDEKRIWQIRSFLQKKDTGTGSGNLSLSSMFGFGAKRKERDPIEFGHAGVDMLTRDVIVDEFLDEATAEPTMQPAKTIRFDTVQTEKPYERFFSKYWEKLVGLMWHRVENPFHSESIFVRKRGEIAPTAMAQELARSREKLRRAQREYLLRHPDYNVSLKIFTPNNRVRRFCQRLVGPSHGPVRFEGVPPYKPVWYAFSGFVYCSIVTMVIIACITTPIYQKEYFQSHGYTLRNWFLYTDIGFAGLFTIEAIIKIIADGFYWTPNAYLRNIWGVIDSVVLITLWISVGTSFANQGEVARAVGAFKALRALRLLNVSDSAKETFHSILYGARKLVSAAFVSLSLLIPFAIYGLNLFSGKMLSCNDGSNDMQYIHDCIFEYPSTPYNWDVLAPRVASNPWYNFDSFPSSLFILFQIVSQEGWTDVMWQAMSIVGIGQQPVPRAAQVNAIFFVAFNLLGAVFVLTLFVSVFIRNYTEQTGVAFLTAEQRSWLELRKILRQVRPPKRPVDSPDEKWKAWCYNRATRKHGRWNGFITTVLVMQLLLLIVEYYPSPPHLDTYRDLVFLAFTLVYTVNIVVRIIGLTWKQFAKSRWDMYGLFVVTGTLGTTIAILFIQKRAVFVQFQKLFLVLDTLLLIPRNNQLDQLFKTAAASFTAIANLMVTWLVLFLVYSIALTQTFGLTKIGPNGNRNLNFRTVPNALIVLFRMSCGEGWDQIMDDFSVTPPSCVSSDSFFETDCGSKTYARFLFISWNIISMYIFVSMFVSLIFESFSYVFQQSGNLQVVSREDIRKFKRAWSKYDPRGLGYLQVDTFPRLLKELDGIFTMKIYEEPHTVKSLLADCRIPPESDKLGFGVDLDVLNRRMATLPIYKIRRQRVLFSRFYEECLVSVDKDRGGVTFTSVLITLAHYKIVSDNKSLKLEEYLRRRAKLQLVEEQMQRNTVKGFFRMLFDMRRYEDHLRKTHKSPSKHSRLSSIPRIFVESEPIPQAPTLQITPVGFDQYSIGQEQSTGSSPSGSPRASHETRRPVGNTRNLDTPRSPLSPATPTSSPKASPRLSPRQSPAQPSPHLSPTAGPSQPAWHNRARGYSEGAHSIRAPHVRMASVVSSQDVRDAIEDSSWGRAIRRSVTSARRNSAQMGGHFPHPPPPPPPDNST